jgi:hypothetical protein
LETAWAMLRPRVNNRHLLKSSDIGQVMKCRPNTWDTRVKRGRRYMIERLGRDVAKNLFPYWPSQRGEGE